MVLLAGVQAESQALLRPTKRFERSTGVARGVLDVDVPGARGAIEARIVQERGAEQQLTVIRDAARVSEALGDQKLANGVPLHVTAGLLGGRAQGVQSRGLGLRADELVGVSSGLAMDVTPRERP